MFSTVAGPLSVLYGLAVYWRNRSYDSGCRRSQSLPGKVISIGNLVVGGTGKSPVTIAFANRLISRSARPAILARGYGSGMKSDEIMVLRNRIIAWRSHPHLNKPSDEGLMQSAALPDVPIILGANRYAAAQFYLDRIPFDQYPSHWLLDDGFQHRSIARQCNIVLVDASQPLGSERLLPAGNLRESPQALARANLVIATRAKADNAVERIRQILAPYYRGPVVAARFETGLPGYLAEQHDPVLVVAGIANPEDFLQRIEHLGVKVAARYFVPDHAPLELESLEVAAQRCRAVVTTAKDYWRAVEVFARLPLPVLVTNLVTEINFDLVDPLIINQ